MSPELNIARLPVSYRPAFDCINANDGCPSCKRRPDNHGVSGSVALFIVRAEHEGRRHAVALRVLGGDYLPVTRAWWRATGRDDAPMPHKAAELGIHREDPDGESCDHLGDGRLCVADGSYFDAEALFAEHGNSDSTTDLREQPEQLWFALEQRLVKEIFGKAGGDA